MIESPVFFERMEAMEYLASYMEKDRLVGTNTSTYRSVTGEPYIVFGTGYIKEEGADNEVYATSVTRAIDIFKCGFDEYSHDRMGVIYWRVKPTITLEYALLADGSVRQLYKIYARFLISDKPVLKEEDAISDFPKLL